MKQQKPLELASLASVGSTVIGTLVVGLVLGIVVARITHWGWAVVVGILLGFAAGMVAMFRQLSAYMR